MSDLVLKVRKLWLPIEQPACFGGITDEDRRVARAPFAQLGGYLPAGNLFGRFDNLSD